MLHAGCIVMHAMSTKPLTFRLQSRSVLASGTVWNNGNADDWQIEEIEEALKEADCGDFAEEREVRQVMDKWTKN